MPVSEARLAANRASALKSTGPRTQAGKDRSRMNALKHGLCSEVVRVPEDQEGIDRRSRAWLHSLKPQNAYHGWMMDEASVLTFKLERCERIERRVRDAVSLRAETGWDDDRRALAEATGSGLASNPAGVVEDLRKTPHGCDWLAERWALLARAADRFGSDLWSADQTSMAFDLLGIHHAFRQGSPAEVVDRHGRVVDEGTALAQFARARVDDLLAHRETLVEEDQHARTMVEADLVEPPTDELRLTRRYEAVLHKRLRWTLSQIASESPRIRPSADLEVHHFQPRPEHGSAPAPASEAPAKKPRFCEPPHAPFELEAEEIPPVGVRPDYQAILDARKEKKHRKAEARRLARRKKLEVLVG